MKFCIGMYLEHILLSSNWTDSFLIVWPHISSQGRCLNAGTIARKVRQCPGIFMTFDIFDTDDYNVRGVPIPVSGQLVEAFVTACKDMTWSAECITCNEGVTNRSEAQNHLEQKHQVLALAEQSPVSTSCVLVTMHFIFLPNDLWAHSCIPQVFAQFA